MHFDKLLFFSDKTTMLSSESAKILESAYNYKSTDNFYRIRIGVKGFFLLKP